MAPNPLFHRFRQLDSLASSLQLPEAGKVDQGIPVFLARRAAGTEAETQAATTCLLAALTQRSAHRLLRDRARDKTGQAKGVAKGGSASALSGRSVARLSACLALLRSSQSRLESLDNFFTSPNNTTSALSPYLVPLSVTSSKLDSVCATVESFTAGRSMADTIHALGVTGTTVPATVGAEGGGSSIVSTDDDDDDDEYQPDD